MSLNSLKFVVADGVATTSRVKTGGFFLQYQRVTLDSTSRLILEGTARGIVTDFGGAGSGVQGVSATTLVMGTPREFDLPFTVPDNFTFDQMKRLVLRGLSRATVIGTGQLVVSDDMGVGRSRLTLSGSTATV